MKHFLTPSAAAAVALSLFGNVSAHAAEGDWFFGAGGGIAWLEGSSDTTNGGAAFGGGGTVTDVEFDDVSTYGALLGRRIGDGWAVAISYDHVDADVSFVANYAALPLDPSAFSGNAKSEVLMLNALYSGLLSTTDSDWSFHLSAAAGVAINSLDVTEDFNVWDGVPDVALASGDTNDFAARGTAGIGYAFAERWAVHGSASIFTLGTFETGSTRRAPLETITPYEVDAWGFGLTIGITKRF